MIMCNIHTIEFIHKNNTECSINKIPRVAICGM